MTTKLTIVAALAMLASCPSSVADAPKPKPEPPPSVRFERDMMVRFHMHENFDLVRAIERLLIRGKLDEAKRFAEAIAAAPDEPEHGPWIAYTVAVRSRAGELARATTVDDALRADARLAVACGSCHKALEASPQFRTSPALPPDKPTLDARMLRHRWAADRMWEGIVGNADEPWRAGLDVVAAKPLELGPERAPFALQLERLAKQARRPGTVDDRAKTYGEILATCAGCHTMPAAERR
jgi:cytochrome c553